jgi:biopolymer transport protein ExbD
MSENNNQKDPSPYINITPLIDVLLVLLIIFMVVSPLKASRFEAKIPSEPIDNFAQPNPWTLVVTIDKNLQVKLNKSEMGSVSDLNQLSTELSRIFQARKENGAFQKDLIGRADLSDDERRVKTVFIKAPRSIAYGEVVKVMDAIKGAGAAPIGLQIDDLNN